ncbi:MAG: flippase-like domain-containing protein [Bacteroidaceae bacterium]|nr:flippase-like domain-containing protein [Bacteroidaceae bacterium]
MKPLYRNLFFVFGIACVVFMALHFDTDGTGAALFLQGAWPWLPVVLGVWIFVYMLNGVAYRTIVNLTAATPDSPRLSYPAALRLTVSGFAFSYITPMGFGGLPYRIMELRPRYGTTRATASTLLYSMTHVLSHFLLWTTAALLFPVVYAAKMDATLGVLIALFVCLAALVYYLFLRGVRSGVAQKLLRVAAALPLLQRFTRGLAERYGDSAARLDECLAMLHRAPRAFIKALMCEYFARLVNTWEFVFILLAFGVQVSYADALMVLAFSSLVGNVFFFLPLQLGAREGGVAAVFALLGLAPALGIYTALYTRVREIFWVAVGVVFIKVCPKALRP